MRLSIIRTDSGSVLKVDGVLTAERVPMLESTSANLERPLALDLSELCASDEAGIQAPRRLMDAGAALRGLSPFIALSLGLNPASTPAEGP